MVQTKINVEDIVNRIRDIDTNLEKDIGEIKDELTRNISGMQAEADQKIESLRIDSEGLKRDTIEQVIRLIDDENQMLITQIKDIS